MGLIEGFHSETGTGELRELASFFAPKHSFTSAAQLWKFLATLIVREESREHYPGLDRIYLLPNFVSI